MVEVAGAMVRRRGPSAFLLVRRTIIASVAPSLLETGVRRRSRVPLLRTGYLISLIFMGRVLLTDTGCSSSTVAIHLACQSFRMRECAVSLAGGVSLTPKSDRLLSWTTPGCAVEKA